MINFLAETEYAIKYNGYLTEDIDYITSNSKNFTTNWHTFSKFSNFEYNNSFTKQRICRDLVIVFKDGCWLKRVYYSGERWVLIVPPLKNIKELRSKDALLNI